MDIISVDGFSNSFKPRHNFIKTATPKRSSIFKRVRAAKMNSTNIISSGGLFNSAKPNKTAEFKAEQLRRKAEQLRRNAIDEELKTKIAQKKSILAQTFANRAAAGAKRAQDLAKANADRIINAYGPNSSIGKHFARLQRERGLR